MRVDVGLTLRQRLEECGQPAIGLEYITEYVDPNPVDTDSGRGSMMKRGDISPLSKADSSTSKR